MRIFVSVLGACVLLGCISWEPPPDAARLAGPRPDNYKERIVEQLDEVLFDSESARFKWGQPPVRMWGWENPTGIGHRYYGWGVCFKVNAKNRMGGYVGYKQYFAMFTAAETLVDHASHDSWRPVRGCSWSTATAAR